MALKCVLGVTVTIAKSIIEKNRRDNLNLEK